MHLPFPLILAASLFACSGAPPAPWTPADGAPSCSTLPSCSGPIDEDATYGAACLDPVTSIPFGWRGAPVCCAEVAGARRVLASCVSPAIGGKACDPDFPVSCDYPFACTSSSSCAAASCCTAPREP